MLTGGGAGWSSWRRLGIAVAAIYSIRHRWRLGQVQACLVKAFNKMIKLGRILVRKQPPFMRQGILRIDTERFVPHGPGFLPAAKLTICRRQKNPTNIAMWVAMKAPLQDFLSLLVTPEREIAVCLKMEK